MKSIDYSKLLNHVSQFGKNWHGENITIISKIEKAKLLVYFFVQGLPNFLTRDLVTPTDILSTSHSLRPSKSSKQFG